MRGRLLEAVTAAGRIADRAAELVAGATADHFLGRLLAHRQGLAQGGVGIARGLGAAAGAGAAFTEVLEVAGGRHPRRMRFVRLEQARVGRQRRAADGGAFLVEQGDRLQLEGVDLGLRTGVDRPGQSGSRRQNKCRCERGSQRQAPAQGRQRRAAGTCRQTGTIKHAVGAPEVVRGRERRVL
jgi:hypothetical protein